MIDYVAIILDYSVTNLQYSSILHIILIGMMVLESERIPDFVPGGFDGLKILQGLRSRGKLCPGTQADAGNSEK